MSIIDTLRPTANISTLDWTTVPVSGVAWVVTSDNSDATYVVGQFGDAPLVLNVGPHGVPVGHRRHLGRVRARGRNGQVTGSVRLPGGSGSAAFSTFDFGTGSFTTLVGSWGGGLPPTTSGDFGVTLTAEATSVNVAELYVDIDSRAQPTYDPQISDGSTVTTVITTTSAPTVAIVNVDTDNLPVSRWRAWVTPPGSGTIAWDSGSVAGSPVATQTAPLVNGSYTLHVQLWSLLGDGSEYAGAEDTLDFTVNLQPVAPPLSLEVTQVAGTPLFELLVTVPSSLADYDTPPKVEWQRSGCGGEAAGGWTTIALTGPVTVTGTASYVDWTAPRTLGDAECAEADVCEFEYRARFVGTKSGQLVTSEWVYETSQTGLVSWQFTGNTLNPTVILNVTATPVSGFGLFVTTTSQGYTTDPELNTGTMPSSTFNAGRYVHGTATGAGLGQLRRLRLLAARSSSSGQRGFHVRTSADNFSGDVYATAVQTTRTTWSYYDLALNIPVTGSSITLHLHSYAVSGGGMEFDNIEMLFGEPVTHSLEWPTADVLLRTRDSDNVLWAAACGLAEWDVDKPFTAQLGVMGGQQVSSGSPGGHDLTLNLAVTSQEDLELLERILERQLVLVSPTDSAEQWSAPSDVGVTLVKIHGVRTLVTRMVGTGPEPAHEPGEVLE